MSFSILFSPTAELMPVSTECAAALLSFRYPSNIKIPWNGWGVGVGITLKGSLGRSDTAKVSDLHPV